MPLDDLPSKHGSPAKAVRTSHTSPLGDANSGPKTEATPSTSREAPRLGAFGKELGGRLMH